MSIPKKLLAKKVRTKTRQKQIALNRIGVPDPGWLADKSGVAARYLVSERTIDNWIRRRRIPFIKCGRVVRFNLAQCDAALERFTVRAVS